MQTIVIRDVINSIFGRPWHHTFGRYRSLNYNYYYYYYFHIPSFGN